MLFQKSKVLFVHIPKTGGTSITHFLNTKNLDTWQRNENLKHHDPLFELEKNNDIQNTFIFTVVRNPYERAISYFHHFNFVNKFNYTFLDFLDVVNTKGCIPLLKTILKCESHLSFLHHTPMIFFTQSDFIFSNKNNKINKVYYLENLLEFEKDFGVSIPFLNKNHSNINYSSMLDNTSVKKINHVYNKDFTTFNFAKIYV